MSAFKPRHGAWWVAALVPALLFPSALQNARANGDTRTLRMYNNHTRESINITFKRDGRYDRDALQKINWFLRDWRKGEQIEMDPRLIDLVWEVYRDLGASTPIHIICGYRSAGTNNMLRARSSGVAEHSQHTMGRAMDIAIPGVPTERLREMGMLKQKGGVGYYASTGFVHLDVGNVRAWPRMTTNQLARLFPRGGTLHLPSDGPPLPGYDVALARLGRDGKRGGEDMMLAYADRAAPPVRNALGLFDNAEPAAAPQPAQPTVTVAAVMPTVKPAPLPLARPQFPEAQLAAVSPTISAPMPLLRPAMLGRVTVASVQPKPELTALHFDATATAGFFSGVMTERKAALTAPRMQLAARDLNVPAAIQAKEFGPRRWLRFASFTAQETRLAMNSF